MSHQILMGLWVSAVYSDSHSLRYYYTGVSAPGSGLAEFSVVGYVDDQQIDLYTSDIGKAVPVAPWMAEGPEHWRTETQIDKADQALFRYEVQLSKERHNHTEGFHFIQLMAGCERREDASTVSSEVHSYDGREYMFYDTQTELYIPISAGAQSITQRWNKPRVGKVERTKIYLKEVCIEKLKRYIENGREDLERRVRPGVKVTGRESAEVTKLHCLVYGFHPRAVDVKWMKNRTDEVPTYETTHILPNPDGTYQIRVSVEVIPQEGHSYSCYVDHSSLEEPLLVNWDPEQEAPLSVVIGVGVISVLVLTAVVVGVIIYRSKRTQWHWSSSSAVIARPC